MTKFPVWATIKDAYGYVFHNYKEIVRDNLAVIGAIFGLIVVSVLVFSLLAFGFAMKPDGGVKYALWLVSAVVGLGLIVLFFYAGSVLETCFIRQAMGLPTVKQRLRPFSDHDANVLLLSYLTAFFIIMMCFAVPWLLIMGLMSLSEALGILGGIVLYCAMVYTMVRAMWQIGPVVVAEHHVALKDSWKLDKGNFWRIFAIILGILIPYVVLRLLMGVSELVGGMMMTGHFTPNLIQTLISMHAWGLVALSVSYGVLMGIVSALLMLIMLMCRARAQAQCYLLCKANADGAVSDLRA